MKVILNTDVPNLGEEGDILEVKAGYARNFLLPRGLVTMYNRQNLAMLDGKRALIEKKKEEKRRAALSEKDKIDSMTITFSMPAGENGKLFGAVTAQMIVDELAAQDIHVERKRLEIAGHTLKAVGDYKVHVKLYNETSADLKIKVVPESLSQRASQAVEPLAQEEPKTEESEEAEVQAEPQAEIAEDIEADEAEAKEVDDPDDAEVEA